MLKSVMAAALARYILHEGDDVTFDQLAALAQVAEKTVRMAANPKLKNALRTISAPGNRAYIRAEDALEWLGRRKDFRPTRFDAGSKGQPPIRTPEDLARVCAFYRNKSKLAISDLRKKLGWSAGGTLAYQNMEAGLLDEASDTFTPAGLVKLATMLGVPDVRKFAQDAVRVLVTAKPPMTHTRRAARPPPAGPGAALSPPAAPRPPRRAAAPSARGAP